MKVEIRILDDKDEIEALLKESAEDALRHGLSGYKFWLSGGELLSERVVHVAPDDGATH